ncbi:MAG: hypothetical protein AB7F89_20325, partial [Pirellulaceae bacterium]
VGFAFGAAIVSFFLIRLARRAQQRRRRDEQADRGSTDMESETPPPRSALSLEIIRGQVELHETARELMGQLDTKMQALQVLIAMADDAESRLREALAESESDPPDSGGAVSPRRPPS